LPTCIGGVGALKMRLQIWATWLFYAVLVDLGDAVADAMALPFDRISLEMLFRGIYHFTQARHKGKASEPIAYFADPQNIDLAIIKQIRKQIPRLDLRPFPIWIVSRRGVVEKIR
jgi:hypothetical protein